MRTAATLFQSLRADLPTATLDGWSPDLRPDDVAAQLLLSSVVRKFVGDEPISDAAHNAAIQKFLDANKCAGSFTEEGHVNTSLDEVLLGGFHAAVRDFFDDCVDNAVISDNALEHFGLGIPGPGASIGTRATDMLHKMFDSAVSVTSGLLPIWQYCTTSEIYEPLANAFFIARERHGLQVVEGSKISVVPKTVDVGRVIATEPSANMWMQRGLSIQLEAGLERHFGINLSNQQEKNRILAQNGSAFDSLVTLDLESASDLISTRVLHAYFPRWFADLVGLYRSPVVEVPDHGAVKLHMVSTMGNGFTFSLMTIIMCCVVKSAASSSGARLTRWSRAHASRVCSDSLPLTPGNWGVFGDDIICPKEISLRVVRLLGLLGLKVNSRKSFVEGPFRESCGGFYFRGEDVRPVFVKHIESRADLYVLFNSLSEWAALHGFQLTNTLKMVLRWLDGIDNCHVVPFHLGSNQGIKFPSRFLGTDHPKDENGSSYYECLEPRPQTKRVRQGALRTSAGFFKVMNHFGVSQCFVAGHIRDGRYSVRETDRKSVRYRTTHGVSPSWDHRVPEAGRSLAELGRVIDVLELAFM